MSDGNAPPPEWKLTPLSRALLDFNILLDSPAYGPFFRSVETIAGILEEQKRITRKAQLLYYLTFIGACLILLGPLPAALKMSVGGVEAPISIIPQQFIALVTAVAYGQYVTIISSMFTIGEMVRRILQKEGVESWQFFAARFDATLLWGSALTPKQVGYRSPRRHAVLAALILLVVFGSLLAHSVVVCGSTALAFWAARNAGSVFLICMGGAAAIMSFVSFLSIIVFLVVRMPFRLTQPSEAPRQS